jgi:hypothetical protein
MHPIMFSPQMGWFVGKRIDLHACGPRMKPHNWQSGGQWWNVDQIFSTFMGYWFKCLHGYLTKVYLT